ncbi:nucleoside deaminase [Limnobacter parvus]|uniref:tRNA-specific adenosine deaminase n=1 Tax=Limnobacter parvus TaxID=2939690 RepID=A0ABT1XI28_9BURK|nr:nucleoside deaminase [Limnobacter parvus]MCR2746951.1 nucleoside deaminase [Limnobacter parvus]
MGFFYVKLKAFDCPTPNMHNTKFPVQANPGSAEDHQWMQLALAQANLAAFAGEVPIGAVVVQGGKVIASAHNAPISKNDACAHAEIQVIQQACQAVGNYRLGAQATMYVTLQPCLMCLGAILHARIGRVVVGCSQSRYNSDLRNALKAFEESQAWHPCSFETGCMDTECETVLTSFFQNRRRQREQSIRELAGLMHLPNVNKETIVELAHLGYSTPEDFLQLGLEKVADDLALRARTLKDTQATQQAAILASLCDYFKGEPVRSWKQYL